MAANIQLTGRSYRLRGKAGQEEACKEVSLPAAERLGRDHRRGRLARHLVLRHDGSGPALYVGGSFPGLTPLWANGIFKWDGSDVWPVNDGVSNVFGLAVFDDGNGAALYAGGAFEAAYDLPAGRIVKLTGCPVSPPCPADLDGDGAVGVTDFLLLLAAWGPCPNPPASCPADLDGDGSVGVTDFLTLLAAWGACP